VTLARIRLSPFLFFLLFCSLSVAGASDQLSAPEDLGYRSRGDSLIIFWSPVEGASAYELSFGSKAGARDFGSLTISGTTVGPLAINGLTGFCYISVRAVAGNGRSGFSDEIVIKLSGPQTGSFSLGRITALLIEDTPGVYTGLNLRKALSTIALLGPEALFKTAARLVPGLYSTVSQGLLIDFGDGYQGMDGLFHTGSVLLSYSNMERRGDGVRAGFSLLLDQVHVEHEYLADGAMWGSLELFLGKNGEVAGSLTLQGVIGDLRGPTEVGGMIYFDSERCPDYPTGGGLYAVGARWLELIIFPPSCDGMFLTMARGYGE
jgi:hypothetical protein